MQVALLPDGHRIFRDGDIATIADDSGETPDETYDGVLYLDLNRPLIVGVREDGEHLAIPLRDAEGRESATPTNAATMLLLSEMFGWPMQHAERQYVATNANTEA